jgi:hypothetical protein
MITNVKGKGAVGICIAYYALRGMVSIPLEPCEYNLIFDDEFDLHRIKVISCSYKTKYGVYAASIRTSGGNQPNSRLKKFDSSSCDIVFIVTSNLDMYAIPSTHIDSARQISLNKYADYQVKFIAS